jgi:acyl-CoA thioester hydrolase
VTPTRLPIRWRDLDPLGHVNAVVFLTYLEEGRNIWLRDALGPAFGPEQYVVARAEIDFRSEIPQATEYVWTDHELESVGRSSLTLRERLHNPAGTVVAESRVVLVLWMPDERRPRRVHEEERQALARTG